MLSDPNADSPNNAEILAAYGVDPNDPSVHLMQVSGSIAGSGDHYVMDTGQGLVGAPDANGMFTVPMNADGTFAGQPQGSSLGPNYTDSPTYHQGASMAPQDYMGPTDDAGRGALGGLSGAPSGMLDYSGGDGIASNWQDFSGRDSSSGGGFFTIADLYGARGQDIPHSFQSGSNLPSTNNYRMLPPAYRKPNYIMRNGQIIDTNSYLRGPPDGAGGAGIDIGPAWNSGAHFGTPAAWASGPVGWAQAGWPGQIGAYDYLPPGS
jgi:hypothetical protein